MGPSANTILLSSAFMTNSDLNRLINSDEIQSIVEAPKDHHINKHAPLKKNPLRNKSTMRKLNPYSLIKKEQKKKKTFHVTKSAKTFYKQLPTDSKYQGKGYQGFQTWLG